MKRKLSPAQKNLHTRQISWQKLHIDPWLLLGLLALSFVGLFILYSASNQSMAMIERQVLRLLMGFGIMIVFAQIPPYRYQQWSPWFYGISLFLLLMVLFFGHYDHGAKRWLSLGFIRFQPSELMKLAMPMMLAHYLNEKLLPPTTKELLICALILAVPVFLTLKQPDLGTAVVIGFSGLFVVLLGGMNWRLIVFGLVLAALLLPIGWHFMHPYQRQRILVFLNPQLDPLGSGYHIIQSKISIGSGGFWGKGWLMGTQSRLQFLPTHTTDFIFAVSGEELGFSRCVLILLLYLAVIMRCLFISGQGQNTYARLLAGSLALTFFLSIFINIGMVTGILPVVGIPLPLISYGGTSMVSLMASFGIIMSVQTHRKLWSS